MRGAITVADLCELYLADAKSRIKASTWVLDRSRIETHVKPLVGRLTVRSLTAADIERMKADIIAGKTARPRNGRGGNATGGPATAARTGRGARGDEERRGAGQRGMGGIGVRMGARGRGSGKRVERGEGREGVRGEDREGRGGGGEGGWYPMKGEGKGGEEGGGGREGGEWGGGVENRGNEGEGRRGQGRGDAEAEG